MKRIIVFRFHKLPEICLERLNLLKQLNPSVEIFGLFGGESDDAPQMQAILTPLLENIFSIAEYAPAWKWRFSDLALYQWFANVGMHVNFDVAHLIEWDLLLCKPLDNLYAHIASDSLGLTAVRRVEAVETNYALTTMEPFSLEWKKLLKWAEMNHGYSDQPLACLGPGYCVPRRFLEAYSSLEMPEISIDELRIPLAAQLLGMAVEDTRLCRDWFVEEELKIFNTKKKEVAVSVVNLELRKPKGRRAFHPFRVCLGELAPMVLSGI